MMDGDKMGMTATYDGYLYVAENGAESDNGKFWSRDDGQCPDMPDEITYIGGPLDGHTSKRGPTGYDVRTQCYATIKHYDLTISRDLRADRSEAAQDRIADRMARLVTANIAGRFDCSACVPLAIAECRRHVADIAAGF